MGHRFTYVVSPEEERENLTVEWFLRRHGYSRHIITGLKRTEDGIFRNGVRAWTSQAVHAGDVIETHLVETEPSDGILPRPVPFSVVYEDDDILVVDKPADTPIHPSIGNHENTLANGIAWYFEQKGEPFVYRCINRLNGSLIQRTVDFASGERSVTHYRTLAHCSVFSHLELNLETGRTHQIRVHMAYIGHPLLGDTLYNKTPGTFPRQALHSASLSFVHPITGEPLNFHAPLPEDMQNLLT